MEFSEHKILPFTTAQGEVPGHAVNVRIFETTEYHRFGDVKKKIYPTHVVFDCYSQEAECTIETVVHIHNWTKYMKRKWPSGGRIHAVIMSNGERWHAEALYCGHSTESYERAPLLARDAFKIRGLCNKETLVEIVGVHAYLSSKRRPEDEALILDPWARDNAAFHARMAALQQA